MSSELPGLLSSFISTPEANKFYDISIVDKDGGVHSMSKIIIAAHSNVLYNIFTHDKYKTSFHLPTVPGLSLLLILDWIESGELALSWTNVLDVLETAEFLDIPLVSSVCQEWLEVKMHPYNVLGIWRFATDHFLSSLERSSWRFVTSRFVEIYKEEEFPELPAEMLWMLLASDQLSCREEEVWEGLMAWVGDNKREEHVTKMMETVRFGLLESEFFLRRVQPHPMFQGLAPKVEEVLSRLSLTKTRHYFVQPRCPQSLLFVFGGWSGSGPVSTISVYDPAAAMWRDLTTTLPHNWAYMATVVVGTEIFLCGGHIDREGEWATRMLMKFCPNTMEVSRLTMMRERRNYNSLAVHSGSIYAIGGNNHTERLSTVERFDISRNQWYMVRSMHRARSDAGSATLRGKIYVVGGFDGVAPTSTAEVYCPGTGRWNMIRSMRVARSGVGAVAMEGLLYLVGGWDGQQRLRSGEVYNPDTKMWIDLPDMKTPRSNHSLAVVPGRLVVMGGYQGLETTRRVEVLDMTTNTWEDVGELSTSRSALASGVVTFNSLEEEVRESLRWQQKAEEEVVMDEVLDGSGNTMHNIVEEDTIMEDEEDYGTVMIYIDYDNSSDDSENEDMVIM